MHENRKKISVIIIAKNEEKKIRDCLESVRWVDEIILVDNGSIDKTVEIAKNFGAKVFSFNKGNYSDWRNEGLKRARGEWILYIDADERVTDELTVEIKVIINSSDKEPIKKGIGYPERAERVEGSFPSFSAHAIPRRNIILGKELKHGGWWPDYVKRLYMREKIKGWEGELHEEPDYKGELGYLENPLLHIKHDNLSDMVEKTNKWSEIEARLMFEANHPPMNIPRFLSAALREFWLRMIRNVAFLDGNVGIIYACYQVYSRFISYAKLWELQIKESKS